MKLVLISLCCYVLIESLYKYVCGLNEFNFKQNFFYSFFNRTAIIWNIFLTNSFLYKQKYLSLLFSFVLTIFLRETLFLAVQVMNLLFISFAMLKVIMMFSTVNNDQWLHKFRYYKPLYNLSLQLTTKLFNDKIPNDYGI